MSAQVLTAFKICMDRILINYYWNSNRTRNGVHTFGLNEVRFMLWECCWFWVSYVSSHSHETLWTVFSCGLNSCFKSPQVWDTSNTLNILSKHAWYNWAWLYALQFVYLHEIFVCVWYFTWWTYSHSTDGSFSMHFTLHFNDTQRHH